MEKDSKLLEMLTGYAAAHQHPFNVFMHMIGIPTIMLGVLIPLTWVEFGIAGVTITLAHVLIAGFFLFYLTLDVLFAVVFGLLSLALNVLAERLGALPLAMSGSIAAVAFFGGYIGQFVGHYVERSMPVLVKHPIQAQVAAPFFVVVEVFKITNLRPQLFDTVKAKIEERRAEEAAELA